MPLPKIIFCESHYDASVIKIITKITPSLKKLGYQVFLAETPASWSKSDYIEMLNSCEEQTKLLQADENLLKNLSTDAQMIAELNIKYADRKSEYNQGHISFVKNLASTKIDFEGIDIPRTSNTLDDYLSKTAMALRDKRFTQAHLNEKRPEYGFIGAAHASGMQREILKTLSLKEASNLFYFVHIYKEAPINAIDEAMRKDKIDHPLGLNLFDLNEMTEDEVVAAIIEQTSILQNASEEYLDKKPKFKNEANRNNSFFNQIEKIETEYGLFTSYGPRTKRTLIEAIEKIFGDNGVYNNRLIAVPDTKGEKYRRELMEFISHPRDYDVIIDKLNILGNKAQMDHEARTDFFSFFSPIYNYFKISCDFKRQTDELVKIFKQDYLTHDSLMNEINRSINFNNPIKIIEEDGPQLSSDRRDFI